MHKIVYYYYNINKRKIVGIDIVIGIKMFFLNDELNIDYNSLKKSWNHIELASKMLE